MSLGFHMAVKIPPGFKILWNSFTALGASAQWKEDPIKDLVFMECNHEEVMAKERYMNIWRSVNDIQVQAGEDAFPP